MRERIGQALEETRRYDIAGSGAVLVNGRLAPEPPAFLPPFEYWRLVEEELARQSKQGAEGHVRQHADGSRVAAFERRSFAGERRVATLYACPSC